MGGGVATEEVADEEKRGEIAQARRFHGFPDERTKAY
jgi:pyrroloquinoline quinone (PQQ) biosynthesis protein C